MKKWLVDQLVAAARLALLRAVPIALVALVTALVGVRLLDAELAAQLVAALSELR